MRVLGVDPGTRVTGWGVVEQEGRQLRGVAAGVCKASGKKPLAERLHCIHEGLLEVIREHRPQAMAVESVFYAKFPKAVIQLGHVRGVVLLSAASHGLPVFEHAPALVKRTVAGRGIADKGQVGRIVAAMLSWPEIPEQDATDALAVAITQLRATQILARLPLRS